MIRVLLFKEKILFNKIFILGLTIWIYKYSNDYEIAYKIFYKVISHNIWLIFIIMTLVIDQPYAFSLLKEQYYM